MNDIHSIEYDVCIIKGKGSDGINYIGRELTTINNNVTVCVLHFSVLLYVLFRNRTLYKVAYSIVYRIERDILSTTPHYPVNLPSIYVK